MAKAEVITSLSAADATDGSFAVTTIGSQLEYVNMSNTESDGNEGFTEFVVACPR